MARYNEKKVSTPVTTYEGAKAFKLDPKIELISILLTGFNNNFYESLNEREVRFKNLIDQLAKKDPKFVAKALIYTRSTIGQRSVTHFGSVALAPYLSGTDFGKRFFSKRSRKENNGGVVFRLDDMMEILSAYEHFNPGKPLPNSMKRGFKLALEAADRYELAKYQVKNRSISLIDIINLVHPSPSKEMESTFKELMDGKLLQFNTVEDKNTSAGKEVAKKVKEGKITKEEAKAELKGAKEDNYRELIQNKKIGYLALLRNIRNILKNSSDRDLITNACNLLTNENFIRKSLVFPHQIDLALETLMTEFSNSDLREFSVALNKAYELSIPNLSELFPTGKTAVVFDSSGSMDSSIKLVDGKKGSESAISKAALIAATLAKGIGADVFHFANYTEDIDFNPNDSVNTLKRQFLGLQGRVGYGTEFISIGKKLGNKYDRVFIISDMQSKSYCNNMLKNSYIYNVDITGYGTSMFKPGDKIFQIFGYTSDIYDMIKKVEADPKAVLKEIEAIEI